MQTIKERIYEFRPDQKPVATAKDGEVLLFVTEDCYDGQIKSEKDIIGEIDWHHTNPATGPVYIEGAEVGDVLAVELLDIRVADQGTMCMISECGPFWQKSEERTHIFRIENDTVYWDATGMNWPLDPMVGVIGTAPDEGGISTGFVGDHGGNMDSRIIKKGATVYLPVRTKGALLAMGDLHATMGDGEVTGNGIEIAGEVLCRVRVVKNFELNWPVTETKDAYFVNTCGGTCDDAIEKGYLEMHRLLMERYGLDYTDAGLYMSIQGYLSSNQACLVDEAGGNTFRVGTPKVVGKPLIPEK